MTFTNDPPVVASVELIPDSDEKADLDSPSGSGGKLVIGQAPNITITETSVVADAAERLALDVQEGDVAIQTNVSSSFIFTGGDNIAPNWEVLDFDAVGAIAGEDIAPNDINALGDILGQSIDVLTVNGADTSAASAGEALTSDGSGNLTFSSLSGSEVVRNGSAIEYVALDVANLPEPNNTATALLTSTDEYAEFTPFQPDPYNITSANFSKSINLQDGRPSGMAWNNDGSRLYEVGKDSLKIYQSDLSTPFDISSASFSTSINSQDSQPEGIAWNNDGSRLYEVGEGSNKIYQSDVSTPYDITSASFDTSINAEDNAPTGIAWNNDGSRLYENGRGGDKIYQYTVSTPFDITSASFDTSISLQDTSSQGIAFNNDGSRLYEVGRGTPRGIYQYTVSTPFDISSASFDTSIGTRSGAPTDIAWNNDGSKLYEVGLSEEQLHEFTLISGGWETI